MAKKTDEQIYNEYVEQLKEDDQIFEQTLVDYLEKADRQIAGIVAKIKDEKKKQNQDEDTQKIAQIKGVLSDI